jgi:methionine-rich copper-binding protein CopC
MRRFLLAAAALAAMAGPAFAHAHLVAANPAVGGTIPAPSEVAISFTEALEPRFSSIEVTNSAGVRVDRADLHIVGGDARRIAVSLPVIEPGLYKVIWHATSVDTHKTEGSFSFTVAK